MRRVLSTLVVTALLLLATACIDTRTPRSDADFERVIEVPEAWGEVVSYDYRHDLIQMRDSAGVLRVFPTAIRAGRRIRIVPVPRDTTTFVIRER